MMPQAYKRHTVPVNAAEKEKRKGRLLRVTDHLLEYLHLNRQVTARESLWWRHVFTSSF